MTPQADDLRSQFVISKNNQGGRRYAPYVFTGYAGVTDLRALLFRHTFLFLGDILTGLLFVTCAKMPVSGLFFPFYNMSLFATRGIDKSGEHCYIQSMTATATLLREIETMPEETAAQLLDFAKFLKSKHTQAQPSNRIATKDAYGIFKDLKGMDTTIERDEEDRV